MTENEILKEISKKGKFCYSPVRWNYKTDTSLNNLISDNKIISLKNAGKYTMNDSFVYIRKGV